MEDCTSRDCTASTSNLPADNTSAFEGREYECVRDSRARAGVIRIGGLSRRRLAMAGMTVTTRVRRSSTEENYGRTTTHPIAPAEKAHPTTADNDDGSDSALFATRSEGGIAIAGNGREEDRSTLSNETLNQVGSWGIGYYFALVLCLARLS